MSPILIFVQAIGRQLGIHESLVNRHPFPGPGIAIRILGDCTEERVNIARQADHIFITKIKEAGLYDEVCPPPGQREKNASLLLYRRSPKHLPVSTRIVVSVSLAISEFGDIL